MQMQMKHASTAALAALLIVTPLMAQAEATAVSPSGFIATQVRDTKTAPAQLYATLGRIGQWWNPQHSWSGKAENLRMELAVGGCFCERWDGDNSVEHARVISAQPSKLLRLQGALGPLQELAVNGVLSFAIETRESGSRITLTYRVSGTPASALDKLAQPVDQVLSQQMDRLVRYADTGAV